VLSDLRLALETRRPRAGAAPRVVPRRAAVWAMVVASEELRLETALPAEPGPASCGLALAGINRFRLDTYMDADLATLRHRRLTAPTPVLALELQAAADAAAAGEVDWAALLAPSAAVTLTATAAGEVDGVVYWSVWA
jgi:hypothetical protein